MKRYVGTYIGGSTNGTRLYLEVLDHENGAQDGPLITHVATGMSMHFFDEKGGENIHQAERDLQRGRRHKHLSLPRVFDQQLRSGIIETRTPQAITVSNEDVAR